MRLEQKTDHLSEKQSTCDNIIHTKWFYHKNNRINKPRKIINAQVVSTIMTAWQRICNSVTPAVHSPWLFHVSVTQTLDQAFSCMNYCPSSVWSCYYCYYSTAAVVVSLAHKQPKMDLYCEVNTANNKLSQPATLALCCLPLTTGAALSLDASDLPLDMDRNSFVVALVGFDQNDDVDVACTMLLCVGGRALLLGCW